MNQLKYTVISFKNFLKSIIMPGISFTLSKLIICVLIFFALTPVSNTAPLFNVPIELKQPDGSIIKVFASGDEYYHRVHDKDNYTITIDDKTGSYFYAVLADGKLTPSKYIVGKVNPLNTDLVKGISILPDQIKENRLNRQPVLSLNKKTGTVKNSLTNLVVFIRFSDENEFNQDISLYDNYFNSINTLIPLFCGVFKKVIHITDLFKGFLPLCIKIRLCLRIKSSNRQNENCWYQCNAPHLNSTRS